MLIYTEGIPLAESHWSEFKEKNYKSYTTETKYKYSSHKIIESLILKGYYQEL